MDLFDFLATCFEEVESQTESSLILSLTPSRVTFTCPLPCTIFDLTSTRPKCNRFDILDV